MEQEQRQDTDACLISVGRIILCHVLVLNFMSILPGSSCELYLNAGGFVM